MCRERHRHRRCQLCLLKWEKTFSANTVTKFIEPGIFVTWWIWWIRRIRQVNEMNDCLGRAKSPTKKKCERREWKLKWFGDAAKSFVCVCAITERSVDWTLFEVSWVRIVAILRWRTSYLSVTGITHPNNLRKKCHESHTQHFAVAEIGAFHAKSFRSQYDVTEWM